MILIFLFTFKYSLNFAIYKNINEIPNSKSGFSTFETGISNNCRPLYYVDLNGDKLNDIIASCKSNTNEGYSNEIISHYVYNEKTKSFILDKQTLTFINSEIISLTANDFTRNGFLDYLITYKSNNEKKNYNNVLYIYDSTNNTYIEKFKLIGPDQNLLVADIGSEKILKIMYYNYNDQKRHLFFFNKTAEDFTDILFEDFLSKNKVLCDMNEKYSNLKIESPNSNGFIDIDGDCINDILISSYDDNKKRYLEIWKGVIEDNEIKYCLSSKNLYNINENFGLFTIVDVDRNAMLDIVFPIQNSIPPKILVAYNIKEMSYEWTSDFCEDHPPINMNKINEDTKIEKILDDINDIYLKGGNQNIQIITLMNNNDLTFYNGDITSPLNLRFVDINQDSYPDFMTIFTNKITKLKEVVVFLSQEISSDNLLLSSRRNFNQNKMYSFGNNIDYNNYDIETASFFDFEENRKMDIIINTKNGNIFGLYNNNIYDTYTLMSITVSKINCYFCTEYGSTQRFITTNINGDRRMDLSIQSPQISIPGALSLTYAYLGIGRSNNYIENFHIISGSNSHLSKYNDKTYTPVIPNSQLVVYHNIKDKTNESTWQVDLVVKPTKNLYQLTIVIILLIILLSIYTWYLQMKENKEDTIENQENFAPWFG